MHSCDTLKLPLMVYPHRRLHDALQSIWNFVVGIMKLQVTIAAVLLSSTAAYAADAVMLDAPVEAPIASVFDWSGAYIGAQIGYGSGEASTDAGGLIAPAEISVDGNGFVGGVYAGWNFQSGNIVYGLETDLNYSDVNESADLGFGEIEIGFDWYGSTRARVGIAADRFLVYGTAGVSYAKAYVEAPGVDESETYVGWTAGAGLDYAFTDNIIGRAEYRYHDFGSKDWGTPIDIDTKLHTVALGVSYKF